MKRSQLHCSWDLERVKKRSFFDDDVGAVTDRPAEKCCHFAPIPAKNVSFRRQALTERPYVSYMDMDEN